VEVLNNKRELSSSKAKRGGLGSSEGMMMQSANKGGLNGGVAQGGSRYNNT